MELDEIRDILRQTDHYNSYKRPPLNLKKLKKENSKLGEFYRILNSTVINSDIEAASLLYNTKQPDTRYMYLKSYFTSHLLDTFHLVDLSKAGISEYSQAIFKAYRNLFIISTLLTLGGRKGAIALTKKTLSLAEKYELHSLSLELLERLRSNSVLEGKKKEHLKYTNLTERKLEILTSEIRAKILEEKFKIHFVTSVSPKPELKQEIEEAINQLESLVVRHDTYLLRSILYRLRYIYYDTIGRPIESLVVCEEALQYLQTKLHIVPKTRLAEFELSKLGNCLLLGDYQKGNEAAKQCELYYKTGTNNWFIYKEFQFCLAMQSQKFHEASDIYKTITSHNNFNKQFKHQKEKWSIFKLYLDFALDFEKRELETGKNQLRKKSNLLWSKNYKDRVRKFPLFSKDKRGFNIGLLIINILILLETDNKHLIDEQIDMLRKYQLKHFRGKKNHQGAILFKLILLMYEKNFDVVEIEKKSFPLEELLANTHPTTNEIFDCMHVASPIWIWKQMKSAMMRFPAIIKK